MNDLLKKRVSPPPPPTSPAVTTTAAAATVGGGIKEETPKTLGDLLAKTVGPPAVGIVQRTWQLFSRTENWTVDVLSNILGLFIILFAIAIIWYICRHPRGALKARPKQH
jgi:hypothetical protein